MCLPSFETASRDPSDVGDSEVGRVFENRPHKNARELTNPNWDKRGFSPDLLEKLC